MIFFGLNPIRLCQHICTYEKVNLVSLQTHEQIYNSARMLLLMSYVYRNIEIRLTIVKK